MNVRHRHLDDCHHRGTGLCHRLLHPQHPQHQRNGLGGPVVSAGRHCHTADWPHHRWQNLLPKSSNWQHLCIKKCVSHLSRDSGVSAAHAATTISCGRVLLPALVAVVSLAALPARPLLRAGRSRRVWICSIVYRCLFWNLSYFTFVYKIIVLNLG